MMYFINSFDFDILFFFFSEHFLISHKNSSKKNKNRKKPSFYKICLLFSFLFCLPLCMLDSFSQTTFLHGTKVANNTRERG